MPVFKGAMKVAKQNLGLIFMYIGIISLVLILTITQGSASAGEYTASRLEIAFVDEDNSPLSQALQQELSRIHTLEQLPYDPAVLQERLYYRDVVSVVRVPKGFGEDAQAHPLQVTDIPGSYSGFYLNGQIHSFLRQIVLYQQAGYTLEESLENIRAQAAPQVEIMQQEETGGVQLGGFYQFIPYGALCMLCFIIGNVMMSFMKVEIKKRTDAAAYSGRRVQWELFLAVAVFGLLIFLVFLIMAICFFGKSLFTVENLPYYLLNTAVMIFVSVAVAFVVSLFSKNNEALSGIVNTVALGMSFLCGVFVPLDLMENSVKTVSQFLPIYWYETANQLLSSFSVLSDAHVQEFWQAVGIQLLFAVAILAVGCTLHKRRKR